MKQFILLSVLLLAGCDLFGTDKEINTVDTITYRMESTTENPPETLAVIPIEYSVDAEHFNPTPSKDAFITEYPWEVTLPYFEGPKLFVIASSPANTTLTILKNDTIIARTTSTGGGGPGQYLGVIAGAEVYDLRTAVYGLCSACPEIASFTSNYIGADLSSSRDSDIVDHGFFYPGDRLFISKSHGYGILDLFVEKPIPSLLVTHSGLSPFSLEIQFDLVDDKGGDD